MKNRESKRRESTKYWYLLLVPTFLLITLVEFYPLAYGIYLSASDAKGNLYLGNYVAIALDPAFWNSVVVSLTYSVGSTVMALAVGLLLAFLLMQDVRGRRVFEALYVFPLATAPIVVGVLWSPSSVWDDINTFLHFVLKLPYIDMLNPFVYFPIMTLSEAWEWAPLLMLVSLSVVNSVGKETFGAATVHGASNWQLFRMIALPAILKSPVMQFVVVLRFIDAMRAFEIPLAWSNWVGFQNSVGSPVDSLSLYLYKLIFVPSYGFPIALVSTIAVVLLGVTLVSATVMLRLMRVIGG